MGALNQYMKAGLPARAAQLVCAVWTRRVLTLTLCCLQHDELSRSPDIVERVASALLKAGLFDRAGDLFEKVRMNQRALEAYRQGGAFRKAVELCRNAFPNEVYARCWLRLLTLVTGRAAGGGVGRSPGEDEADGLGYQSLH